nr:MAG: DNA pilot protein [Microvirus sp.]
MDPLTGLLSFGSSMITNLFNADQKEAEREFNAQQSQINRDFQERMSNTAYQRAMADMRQAGLNPILAYQKGGASQPSGSQATTTAFQAEDSGNKAISAGMSAKRLNAEVANMEATNENLRRQNDLIHAQTARELSQTTLNETTAKNTEARTAIEQQNLSRAQAEKVKADLEKANLDTFAGRWGQRVGQFFTSISPAVNTAKTLSNVGR